MIYGVGTDIAKISRFAQMTPHFVARVFTDGERNYLHNKTGEGLASSAAGLFAAKEAVAKALGTGFHGFWPVDIEIWHDNNGAPRVRLHNGAAKIAKKITRVRNRVKVQVSISHTADDAVAFAVLSAR
ncbi:MAG: holo-ACP synthase [Defluviitaleaceae bacterium]|nr:holo-ACP synthase [Defluviitaleaceae bacterium]